MKRAPLATAVATLATIVVASAVFEIHERDGPAAAYDKGKCNAR
jgi:hypothetical protein